MPEHRFIIPFDANFDERDMAKLFERMRNSAEHGRGFALNPVALQRVLALTDMMAIQLAQQGDSDEGSEDTEEPATTVD